MAFPTFIVLKVHCERPASQPVDFLRVVARRLPTFALLILQTLLVLLPTQANADAVKHSQNSAEITQEEIFGIASDLASNLNLHLKINVTNENTFESLPGGEVRIGLLRVRNDLRGLSTEMQREVIHFYIGHEIWHQVQYEVYGTDQVFASDESRILYECQADLMGSYLASGRMKTIMVDYVVGDYLHNFSKDQLISLVVALGETYHVGATHPTGLQRRAAVMMGIDRAFSDLLDQQVSDPLNQTKGVDSKDNSRKTELELLANTKKRLASRMYLNPGSTHIGWSLKLCKAITHFRSKLIDSIDIKTEKVLFNKDPNVGTATYSYKFSNLSDVNLCVFGGIRMLAVTQNLGSSDPPPLATAIAFYDLRIQAGGSAVVSGTMPWFGDHDVFPEISSLSGDTGALISAERCH